MENVLRDFFVDILRGLFVDLLRDLTLSFIYHPWCPLDFIWETFVLFQKMDRERRTDISDS